MVTFTPEQLRVLRTLRGNLGRGDAEVVRTIVVSWLMANGYLPEKVRVEARSAPRRRAADAES